MKLLHLFLCFINFDQDSYASTFFFEDKKIADENTENISKDRLSYAFKTNFCCSTPVSLHYGSQVDGLVSI